MTCKFSVDIPGKERAVEGWSLRGQDRQFDYAGVERARGAAEGRGCSFRDGWR